MCRYILVYPQGCDVCNHLSLFLCVADYDKLLPGDSVLSMLLGCMQWTVHSVTALYPKLHFSAAYR